MVIEPFRERPFYSPCAGNGVDIGKHPEDSNKPRNPVRIRFLPGGPPLIRMVLRIDLKLKACPLALKAGYGSQTRQVIVAKKNNLI